MCWRFEKKAPAGGVTRCPLNLNSSNHNQRAGRRRFYLAIARLALCVSPFLRGPSPNCDHARLALNARRGCFAPSSLQSIWRVFGARRCIPVSQVRCDQGTGAAVAVSVLCRSDAGRRQAGAHDDCRHADLMVPDHTSRSKSPLPNYCEAAVLAGSPVERAVRAFCM